MPFEMDSTISIHAPARGATSRRVGFGYAGDHFNPRPREGGDGAV